MRGSKRAMVAALAVAVVAAQPVSAATGTSAPVADVDAAERAAVAVPPGAAGVEVSDGEGRVLGRAGLDPLGRRAAVDAHDPSTYLDGVEIAVSTIRAISTWGMGSPPDFDGDGLADVLLATDGGSGAVQAHRGVDGSLLWSVAIAEGEDAYPVPVGDLTGDGVDDLAVWSMAEGERAYTQDCAEPDLPPLHRECTWTSSETYTWRVGVRSGVDGQMLWSRTIDGAYRSTEHDRRTPTSSERTSSTDATAWWVWLDVLGDVSGDGLPDLALHIEDYRSEAHHASEGTVVSRSTEESNEVSTALNLQVLTGAAGEVLASRDADHTPGWISVRPNGPAGTDLVRSSSGGRSDSRSSCQSDLFSSSCSDVVQMSGPSTTLLTGATLEPRWTRHGWGYPLDADVDGAGAGDLAFDHTGEQASIELVRGEDGVTRWTRETSTDWSTLAPLGDLTGDGLDDLVLLEFEESAWVEEEDEESEVTAGYAAHRIAGATGATLQSTSAQLRGDDDGRDVDAWTWVNLGGDHDADGIADLVASMSVETWNEDAGTLHGRDRIAVESGADGTVLYQLDDSPYTSASSTADLTGDGADELMLSRYRVEDRSDDQPGRPPEKMSYDHVAVDVADGARLWSHVSHWSFNDRSSDSLQLAGDQDGQAGAELLHVRVEGSEESGYTSTVRSLAGETLAERWSLER